MVLNAFATGAPQTLIGDRFSISYQVGSGGGGRVFKAFDLHTKQHVALKFLHSESGSSLQPDQLRREAELLKSLHHPGIVAYVAHGQTPAGVTYLATEWLEGQVLATQLLSGPLPVEECVRLLVKITETLVLVHARDIVHRDLTPSNLFLRDALVDGVMLIDFGLSGDSVSTASVTSHDDQSGTAGYLAPEVIRGTSEVTKAADIFTLGCVLYECLTGSHPFKAGNVTAVLTRTLFEDVTPLRELHPEVSPELEALALRMLAKDPQQRLPDAPALLAELRTLAALTPTSAPATGSHAVLTSGEERLLSVIVAAPANDMGSVVDARATPSAVAHQAVFTAIHAALSGLGEQIEQLADGSLVIAFPHLVAAAAVDMVERAVRGGLLLKGKWPGARVAVVTGRGQFPRKLPLGEAVERAAELLLVDSAYVLTDELTYQLVGTRLDLRPLAPGVFAVGDSDGADRSRPLLGQPTPCVGRESELALLDDTLRTCMTQRVARAVLVTGPSGAGKSRLRHEFGRRMPTQGVTTLLLRGDQMHAGSPFAVVAQGLRRLFTISDDDSVQNNRRKILSHLTSWDVGSETQRVAEMLGEVCGIPFPREHSPLLFTASHDPRVMMEQISQAWVELLAALCAQTTLLIMMEDLHYTDSLSVTLISTALRELAALPLMIVAMGRPEIEEMYPQLWLEREPQLLRLGTLSRRACERLTRHVLGPQFPAAGIARIVEQCGGNALMLEELIRATAEDNRDDVPQAILLMLQARLLRLSAEQRRILRAASLFGDVFWRGGVAAMLGPDYRMAALDETLKTLIAAELIERQPDSRFANEQEFHFRHSLVREAALSLFTANDRTLGHRIAGTYLETAHEPNPLTIAEHFYRGEEPARALPFYLAAAQHALAGCDLEGALRRTKQAMACNPSGEVQGTLRAVALAAHFWRDEWAQAVQAGTESLQLLPIGSAAWCGAAAIMLPITILYGRADTYGAIAQTLGTFAPAPDACRAYLQAASYVVVMSSLTGQRTMASEFRQRVQKYSSALAAHDLAVVGNIGFSETVYARMLGHDPWQSYRLSAAAAVACQQAGDLRILLFLRGFEAIGLVELGELESAEKILHAAVAQATQLHEPLLLTHVRVHLEQLQLRRGAPEDIQAAYDSAHQCVETIGINPLLRGQSLINLARAQLLRGELVQAEATARSAATFLAATPAHLTFLAAVLIDCLLAQRRTSEAAAEARAGLLRIDQLGSGGYSEIGFLYSAVLALRADGAHREAAEATLLARQQVQWRANCIPDQGLRERFLSQVAENRQVLRL